MTFTRCPLSSGLRVVLASWVCLVLWLKSTSAVYSGLALRFWAGSQVLGWLSGSGLALRCRSAQLSPDSPK